MQDVVPKHVSSACSEMSASCTTSSSLEDRKIHNQGTLLDDYQDDDEMGHTTDLLHAIRCWNLDRPTDEHHESDNKHTCCYFRVKFLTFTDCLPPAMSIVGFARL